MLKWQETYIKSEEKRLLKKETWEILIFERRTDEKRLKEESKKLPEKKGKGRHRGKRRAQEREMK